MDSDVASLGKWYLNTRFNDKGIKRKIVWAKGTAHAKSPMLEGVQ